eukprot:CAMPEP_0181189720 /NCGR_PEP_ID=MMETSP1096-20121128/11809_1 /TAXON_ID=156174 ORGANISM="Chrysochromulina ericina, Strain CCMP281" /NCGR_SAMPLE_ID=MMETSP1096 /ASSEMBLY_ACC=CAM_ASM_000453 /LENGTH=65 /DNA_ID=CAMNT_0023278885 /DNA_START=601 /DNA_END=798 /DNA_ORIENTATION=-
MGVPSAPLGDAPQPQNWVGWTKHLLPPCHVASQTLGTANTASSRVAGLKVDVWYWWKSILGGPAH